MKFSLRHQSSGAIYPYLAQTAQLMLRGFFRKIYLYNRKGVPTDKPVLLAVNHPTAFLEPCLLGTLLDPPLYNMTRGDIFQKPFFRKLMESLNMFPVYRVRDGYRGRDRNQDVFAFCVGKLAQNRVVTIYVEGEHHLEKHLRPIQKGILRIAFDAFEKHQLDELQIIPAGCSYRWGDRPRDEALVNIGAPIYVQDYWPAYLEDQATAMQRLGAAIEQNLKAVCLHIDDPADSRLLEQLLTLNRSENPEPVLPIVAYTNDRFLREKAVCDQLNALDPEAKKQLAQAVFTYFSALDEAGLTDAGLVQAARGTLLRLSGFVAGFFPFLIGYLTSLPVIKLARFITEKNVKKREFYSSVWMGAGHLTGMLYYLLWFLVCTATFNPWLIGFSLLLPVLGWFSMVYRETWRQWRAARRALMHPLRERLLALRPGTTYLPAKQTQPPGDPAPPPTGQKMPRRISGKRE